LKKCFHIVKIDIPDWEAAEKYDFYNPKYQYEKCMICKKILEVIP